MSDGDDMDWLATLHELTRVDNDLSRRWGYDPADSTAPNPPASEAALAAVERHLGEPLDPHHRHLLAAADGWPDGFDNADLLGTEDLLGRTDRVALATDNLDAFNDTTAGLFRAPWPEEVDAREPTEPPRASICNADVLPLADSRESLNLVLIGRTGRPCAGQVIHILGSSVTRSADLPTFVRQRIAEKRQWIADCDVGPNR